MNPHQRNKIDISSLSADEQRLFRLYGKLPNKKDLLQNKLKERKYFDSGDYALSKAGKASDTGVTTIGVEHPQPENIPHLAHATSTSPPAADPHNGHNANIPAGMHRGSITGIPGGNLPAGPGGMQSKSPQKEGSFLHRETSVEEGHGGVQKAEEGSLGTPAGEGIPIRR
ncbi:MAG: hypothetical protein Q9160_002637 [Pyrenula sp. 1 TL-2023]